MDTERIEEEANRMVDEGLSLTANMNAWGPPAPGNYSLVESTCAQYGWESYNHFYHAYQAAAVAMGVDDDYDLHSMAEEYAMRKTERFEEINV